MEYYGPRGPFSDLSWESDASEVDPPFPDGMRPAISEARQIRRVLRQARLDRQNNAEEGETAAIDEADAEDQMDLDESDTDETELEESEFESSEIADSSSGMNESEDQSENQGEEHPVEDMEEDDRYS